MDRLFQAKLDRLEAEYAETILAGQRAAERLADSHEYDLIEDSVASDECFAKEENVEVPEFLPPTYVPLTPTEIAQIKSHMAVLKPKFEPVWAKNLSDADIVESLRSLISNK